MSDRYTKSRTLTEKSAKSIAGGAVLLDRRIDPPIVFVRALGNRLWDADGNEYTDFHAAFASHILGHNHPEVNAAVSKAMESGWSLMSSGATEWDMRLAELLRACVPSMERVQFTSSGNEAVAQAIRLSRAWTGRDDIIVTLGGYNGWNNDVAQAMMPDPETIGPRQNSGEYQFPQTSAGIPETVRNQVHVVNFNDVASVEEIMRRYPTACVITEPVLHNVGVIPPQPGYLTTLRKLCDQYGALLVFDEVKSGFRTTLAGYQSVVGIKPDLSVFGKTIANGYPLGVVGGRASVMALLDSPDPAWSVRLIGSYNAHPFTAAAAIATLEILQRDDIALYQRLEALGSRLQKGLELVFDELGVEATISRVGSAFCVYFCDHVPVDWHDLMSHHNFDLDRVYRRALIERGLYLFPQPCRQGSLSAAHTREDITRFIEASCAILKGFRNKSVAGK